MTLRRLIIAALVAAAPTAVRAEDYVIKLTRPDHVGAKHRMTASVKRVESLTISKDGKAVDKKSKTVEGELQAVLEAQKVNKDGHAIKLSVTIERLVDGDGKPLLKKGTVVVAQSVEGETVYRMEGEPLPEKAEQVLRGLVITKTTKTDDDDVFGTKKRQKVGDSWKLDEVAGKKSFEEQRIQVAKISGTTKLTGVKKVGGVKCLDIGVEMNVVASKIPNAGEFEKQGFKYESGVIKAKMSALYPVDLKLQPRGDRTDMLLKVRFVGDKAQTKGFTIDLSIDDRKNTKLEPVK